MSPQAEQISYTEQDPTLVLVWSNDNTTFWTIKHSDDTHGQTFVSIEFEGDRVKLLTDAGLEITILESIYEAYVDSLDREIHMIQEVDPKGELTREYPVAAPTVVQSPGFGG